MVASSKPSLRVFIVDERVEEGSEGRLARQQVEADAIPQHEQTQCLAASPAFARLEVKRISPPRAFDGSDAEAWCSLAARVNRCFGSEPGTGGVVIVHPVEGLEEIAYFLNLTLQHSRPVVVTTAKRKDGGGDPWAALLPALRVASDASSCGRGVLIEAGNDIAPAREAVLQRSSAGGAMLRPGLFGHLGVVDEFGEVHFYRSSERLHTTRAAFKLPLSPLPRVDILGSHPGAGHLVIRAAVASGADGIILAGIPPLSGLRQAALEAARQGVPVVLSDYEGGYGPVRGERDDSGIIGADNLSARKARVLLMLALTQFRDHGAISRFFRDY